MLKLTDPQRKLIEGKNLAHVATLMKDGSPQVTPVWVDCDGDYILINTAEGRQKPRNIERDPRIALSIHDQENIYNYMQVRGRVVEVTREGAWDHINMLARKYRGPEAEYPARPGEVRIIIKIAPEHISGRV